MTTTIETQAYRYHPQYIHCGQCYMQMRVEFIGRATVGGFLKYCPACGSDKLSDVAFDSEQDYWYSIATGFGLPQSNASVEFIKMLYDMWDVRKYQRFTDFVETEAKGVLEKVRNGE